ncbi:RICIN domain-containing protein [Streptomyces sp. NPDC002992]|uniref:RICIN domain-containing protein n=1 Tax=Streptomyces sp. NPDC002992 TaxID=3154273 RepID=UPI0033B2FB91
MNIHSGKCLEIGGWGTGNGAAANQWDCTGGNNQKWLERFNPANDTYQYVNVHSGKCLEIADWSTGNGAAARQWDCTGGKNQSWL